MRAKLINEFERNQSGMETLNLGFGDKITKTKAFKVLEFIAEAGEEGRSHKEIQEYIYFDLNKAPKGEEWFEERSKGAFYKGKWYPNKPGLRKSRGYWSASLGSFLNRKGLLDYYCEKNDKGKWVLKRWPERNQSIIGSAYS